MDVPKTMGSTLNIVAEHLYKIKNAPRLTSNELNGKKLIKTRGAEIFSKSRTVLSWQWKHENSQLFLENSVMKLEDQVRLTHR